MMRSAALAVLLIAHRAAAQGVAIGSELGKVVAHGSDLELRNSSGSVVGSMAAHETSINELNASSLSFAGSIAALEGRIYAAEQLITTLNTTLNSLRSNTANCVASNGLWNGTNCVPLSQTFATNAILAQTVNGLVAQIPGQTVTRCPAYSATTTASGTARLAQSVRGSGVVPGDVRIITCNPGHFIRYSGQSAPDAPAQLFESTAVVTCLANGAWSDGGNTACSNTAAPTNAATPAPVPAPQLVSCCWSCDDHIEAIYVDGQKIYSWGNNLNGQGSPGLFARNGANPSWRGVQGFRFNASRTSVMVVKTKDNGNGCGGGNNVFSCATAGGLARDGAWWNFASPSATQLARGTSAAWWQSRVRIAMQKRTNPGLSWNGIDFANISTTAYTRENVGYFAFDAGWYSMQASTGAQLRNGNSRFSGEFRTFASRSYTGKPRGFACPRAIRAYPVCAGSTEGGPTYWVTRYDAGGNY